MEQEHYELIKEESLHITDRMLAYRWVGVRAGDDVVWLGAMFDDLLVKDESRMNSKSSVGRGCFVPDAVAAYGEEWFGKWRQSGELLMLAPDALLDLDGDGINERISLRVVFFDKFIMFLLHIIQSRIRIGWCIHSPVDTAV